MKEDVTELVKLYEEGSQASSKFDRLQADIVPYRTPQAMSMPQMVKSGPLGIPTFAYPTPEPEHPQTVEFLQSVKQYVDGWIKDVQAVLDRIGKTRYKMQFNDPRGSGSTHLRFNELTKNELQLDNILDDFGELLPMIITKTKVATTKK